MKSNKPMPKIKAPSPKRLNMIEAAGLRLIADDGVPTGPPPAGMALIPAGSFTMGRTSGDTDINAPPVTVNVSAFYMGKYEVTKEEWDEVKTWGAANGYTDLPTGGGKAADHPVQESNWYAIVKWCNARTEYENVLNGTSLVPCYTVGGATYKTGSSTPDCNWAASGYRHRRSLAVDRWLRHHLHSLA